MKILALIILVYTIYLNNNQTQLVGMQAANNFSIECITYLTRRSQLNIEPRNI